MIGPQEADAAVLAFLRSEGPGTVTVKGIAAATGLPRVTVRASVTALSLEGLVCLVSDPSYPGETVYLVRHLHAAPGRCEQPLGCTISEE